MSESRGWGAEPVVSGLWIYPVKSCAGLAVSAWPVDAFGLRHDRRWMVVNGDGEFLTQREHPRLALVGTAIAEGSLELAAPGLPPLVLPLEPREGEPSEVRVWRDLTGALDVGDAAAEWFSTHLGTPCRLVWMGPGDLRPMPPEFAPFGARVSFADAFPFLLISAAALDELNRRLPAPVPMDRFRPNIVVAGTAPHAEDGWRRVRIGGIEMAVVKPCARCVVTTTDQRTAARGKEPLRTLSRYRKAGSNVLFGQNLVHAGPGELQIGAVVEVLERGKPPLRAPAGPRRRPAPP